MSIAQTFLNLPVRDLPKSIAFYTALGFTFNPQFTDETGTCMIINDNTYAMLLTHEKFQGFSKAPIPDAKTSTGMMLALQVPDKASVDKMAETALAEGGSEPRPPQDLGFMYNRTFADPDGHRYEPFFFDTSVMPVN